MSRDSFGDRRVWHVNTVLRGGGVAEILEAMEEYSPAGSPVFRRFIMDPDPQIFGLTKAIHHRLHGNYGGDLPDRTRHERFSTWGRANAEKLLTLTSPDDIVVLHDPQTLPMLPVLVTAGVEVAWRCHIGTNEPNGISDSTWDYLSAFIPSGVPLIFSDAKLVPGLAAGHPVFTIPPSINPRSEKNRDMAPAMVDHILAEAGVPVDDLPILAQISRWDPLKDMTGVLEAFVSSPLVERARLVLCGPSPESVADDPEATEVFREIMARYRTLPAATAARVHLICTSTENLSENNLLVNALQRKAAVVAQKSLQEGFGLTVTEAMWKARPVIGTRRGGLTGQVLHERTGLVLDDPRDLGTFVAYVTRLLDDPAEARRLGDAARRHVEENFLTPREVLDHIRVYQLLVSRMTRPVTGAVRRDRADGAVA